MTKEFEAMLYAFGASARGKSIKIGDTINYELVRKYAIEQGVWSVIYPALENIADVEKYKHEFYTMLSKGIRRKEFTMNIVRKIEDSGIRCCLLKGAVVAELYNEPETRISSDTDILIHPKDEEKLKRILIENGYVIENRSKTDHHLKAYHEIGGLLEAHVMLYSKLTEKIIFNNLDMYSENWEQISINGIKYHTLGINDGLMYLTAHYIKHLVNGGGGVRQIMDLLLYIENNKHKIDFERYNELLRNLRYDKLLETIMAIGAKYFGFDYEIHNESLMLNLLEDTEAGGIFGFETDGRKNFYTEYCESRTTLSKTAYKVFFLFNREHNIINRLFPKRRVLINKYGYKYAKYHVLLPLAWLNRYVDIIFKNRRHQVKVDSIHIEERLLLMKDLNMID